MAKFPTISNVDFYGYSLFGTPEKRKVRRVTDRSMKNYLKGNNNQVDKTRDFTIEDFAFLQGEYQLVFKLKSVNKIYFVKDGVTTSYNVPAGKLLSSNGLIAYATSDSLYDVEVGTYNLTKTYSFSDLKIDSTTLLAVHRANVNGPVGYMVRDFLGSLVFVNLVNLSKAKRIDMLIAEIRS